jgi:hypothetical protein
MITSDVDCEKTYPRDGQGQSNMVPGFENQNPLIEDKYMQAREIILTFGLGMSPRGPKIRATCTLKQQQHG